MLLTPGLGFAVWAAARGSSGWPAGALFAVIAASDVLDGCLARRLGATSEHGRLLDHGADIVFLLCTLSIYAWLGIAPWWVAAVIALSFGSYVADSFVLGGRERPGLVTSRLGHVGGVLNYVLVGVLVGNETLSIHALSPTVLTALFLLVPVYSTAGIISRLWLKRQRDEGEGRHSVR